MSDEDKLIGLTVAGKYQIKRLIGAGGMGSVYEALHTGIGKRVAVKVITHANGAQNDEVDQADAVLPRRRQILWMIAPGENAAVNLRV